MKRLAAVLAATVLGLAVAPGLARGASPDRELKACDEGAFLCAESTDSIGYGGEYTGHDEPSLLFYSNQAGSGNSSLYHLKTPSDPMVMPKQSGTAGTWNFQLHPAFWLGMALSGNQSGP